jgi:3-hydroxyisobutyrate dehydrogenase-like beta-hydroxyacid dehydrogenase
MLDRNTPLALDRNFKAGTPIALILKDLGLIGDLAEQLGAKLEIGKCAERIFEAARQAGYGDEDMAGLVRPYEQVAGVEVKRSV